MFIKPSGRRKNFTGTVLGFSRDEIQIRSTSQRQEVWCAEVVHWKSEFRVYVVDDEVVGVDHYDGNSEETLDMNVVEQALSTYRKSGEAPSAYGIDFGVLETGETTLVEANDGW